MDTERKRVEDDLRGVIVGDVFCDELSVQLYASDASIYQTLPLGVVRPKSAEDVAACVRYATEQNLAIHARGAGSGVAGESLGNGLVIDFSVYMRRWRRGGVAGDSILAASDLDLVRVQPGVVLASLNRELHQDGRQYGPDPATRSVTTLGGVLAVNASGSHYLRSGSARDTVRSLEVVTGGGELLELSTHSPLEASSAGRLARGVWGIFHLHREAIAADIARRGAANGLRLDGVIEPFDSLFGTQPTPDTVVHLAKLLAGTQGTFGLITDATLVTETLPAHRGVALLFFHRLDAAARGAVAAVRHGVVACDLMDRRLLEIARDTEWAFTKLLPRDAEAMVLVELQGDSIGDLRGRLAKLEQDLCQHQKLAFASTTTMERQQRDLYWSLSRRVIPRLYRVRGDHNPVPLIEDVWVPPESLPGALTSIQDVLQKFQVTATVFAHAGHGQLHIRPFLDLASAKDQGRLRALSQQIAEAVWECGGLIGTEHAAGRSRSWLLQRQHQQVWPAMLKLKHLFDPQDLLNPGKLISAVPEVCDQDLRPVSTSIRVTHQEKVLIEATPEEIEAAQTKGLPVRHLPLIQQWGEGRGIEQAVRACNGCGRCRTTAPDQRQCPMFRILQTEEAAPRAKANLLRGVLTGALDPTDLASDRAKEIADLCFGCQQCRLECPASVDIPKIANEIRAQHVATNGLRLSDLLMSRIDQVAAIGSRMPTLSNYLMRSPMWRWILERTFGLSQARALPPLADKSFLRYAAGRRWHRPSPHGGTKVVYFADHYATYHDTQVGIAFAEVLLQNQIDIYVPPKQVASGIARIAAGDSRGAMRIARRNVRILADAVRLGYTVVVTEPAAALALKREYVNLLGDEDSRTVAENTHEACQYLWELHQQNRLSLDFDTIPAEVAYHQPCHVRALDSARCGQRLMELIPGLSVQPVDKGCTGMAGTWGLQRKNYRNSLRIGWPLITAMRRHTAHAAATECSACKMQIEHGSGRSTVHPIKLLAHAYGRLPGFERELRMMPTR
jgi:FAD/FMN-containing dehydrogenase/Fe-S oxidoreductase